MPEMSIGLAIIAKNEENTIGEVIDGASRHLPLDDIFVVDGNSSDQTASIARGKGAQVVPDDGRGKGAALRLAIREIERDILIFMDSDGSHQPEEIPCFLQAFQENPGIDLVLASRFKGGSEELSGSWAERLRLAGNKLITTLINLRWRGHLTDSINGFRAIRRNTAWELALREEDFAIEQEMVMKCLKKRKRIIEFASFEKKRLYSRSHIVPSKMIWHSTRCFFRNIV